VQLKNANGCTGAVSSPATITVNVLPTATVAAKTICAGQTAGLTASVTAGNVAPITYTWNVGGTTGTTNAASQTSQALTATTTYTVQLKNANGCTGAVSSPATITVNVLPTATVAAKTICSGQTAGLTASVTAGNVAPITYTWNVGGTTRTTKAASQTSQALTATTTYTVQLKNANGCTGAVSSPATITVNVLPTATVAAKTICAGQTAGLTASVTAGNVAPITYTWNVGGTTSTTNAASQTSQALTATTTYTVQLKNANGCTGAVSSPATITVMANPTVTVSPAAQLLCGRAVTLTASATAGSGSISAYQWKENGTPAGSGGNSYIARFATGGTYSITVEVTNSNNCTTASGAAVLTVNVPGAVGTVAACTGSAGSIGLSSACSGSPGVIGI
jgi:hypothetical protein